MSEKSPFASIEKAIEDIREGRMVIVVDDEDRENEGDLTMAAEKITPEAVNFMAKFGRGLICVALTEQRLDQLQIPLMVSENTAAFGTAFCESIDAKYGTSTGISAADRLAHHSGHHRSRSPVHRSGAARAHLSAAGAAGRRAGKGGADGGIGGPGAPGGTGACGSHLRNHE